MTKQKLINLIAEHIDDFEAGSCPPLECDARRKLADALRKVVVDVLKQTPSDVLKQLAMKHGIGNAVQELLDVDDELEAAHARGEDVFDL